MLNYAKNWELSKIGECLMLIRGISFPKSAKKIDYKGGLIACLRTKNVQKEVDWNDLWFVDSTFLKREEQIIKKGDILISVSNSLKLLGKVSLIKSIPYVSTLGAFIVNLRVPELLNNKFIFYYLSSLDFKNNVIEKASTTTNISNISVGKLANIFIPIAPLNEQNRIVEKIEVLFSDLDKATEDLKKTREQLKIYRQAILKVAFGSMLEKNIFEIKSVEELIIEKQIGLVKSNKEQNSTGTGVPYIKMNNINTLGDVDINDVVYVEVNDEELGKYILKKNDLLINTRNSFELVGKSGIVKDDSVGRVFNNNILRLRFNNSIIPKFINYQLLSNEIKQQIRKEKKATTNVCALYQGDILSLKFKIPQISIQNDIVNYFELKLSVCDKLEKTIQQSLKKIEYLRQSILKKAFEGKLVSQDPNDLPAYELLKQIKIKKDKMSKNGK